MNLRRFISRRSGSQAIRVLFPRHSHLADLKVQFGITTQRPQALIQVQHCSSSSAEFAAPGNPQYQLHRLTAHPDQAALMHGGRNDLL